MARPRKRPEIPLRSIDEADDDLGRIDIVHVRTGRDGQMTPLERAEHAFSDDAARPVRAQEPRRPDGFGPSRFVPLDSYRPARSIVRKLRGSRRNMESAAGRCGAQQRLVELPARIDPQSL